MRTLLEHALANAAAATALALVALAVGLAVRRPAVRHALWVLVLVRLVLPPVWTVPLPVPFEGPDPVEVASTVVDSIAQAADPSAAEDWSLVFDLPAEEWPDAAESVAVSPVVEAAPAAFPAYLVIGGVWAVGCGFVFARSAWRVGRFRRALRDARPAPAAVQNQAAQLAAAMGLRRCPEVLVVPGRVWPSLWMPGLLPRQAKVLLPAGLVALLDPGQRGAVLAHELAHLRRGDPWVRWLEVLVCGLYWWFPLVVWFRRHLRASEEACCDLWVVAALGGRRAYATALVETAAFLGGPAPVASPILASGAGPVLDLQRRVTMIMQATWPARLTRFGLAAVLGIGATGLAFGPALAQPPERPKDGDRKERPKDGDRPREERPRDRDRDRPGEERKTDAPREKASEAEIQKAREGLEKARKEAREATQRMMEAEERLAKAEGRPVRTFPGGIAGPGGVGGFGQGFPGGGGFGGGGGPGGGFGGGGPGGLGGGRAVPPKEGDRRPDGERPRDGDRRPDTRPVPDGRGPGGGEFRELQQQIEELRRALEQMRQEMRRGGGERRSEPAKDRPRGERE